MPELGSHHRALQGPLLPGGPLRALPGTRSVLLKRGGGGEALGRGSAPGAAFSLEGEAPSLASRRQSAALCAPRAPRRDAAAAPPRSAEARALARQPGPGGNELARGGRAPSPLWMEGSRSAETAASRS